MDAILLARIQFAFTVGFHFLFPPITLGLTFLVLIFETLYLRSKNELYKQVSGFLIKIVGLVFVLGTATGITMEFAFGNNWAEYSKMVGDIFGAPLAAEGIFAFFLESVFLGVLIFGRNRVSKRTYWWSAFFVWFGSHLSGLWILIANSWMQTPAGYKIVEVGGKQKAVLTDFWEAVFNPSTLERFSHTIIAGWITGALFAAGIAAWYLVKKRHLPHAKSIIKVAMILFIVSTILQFGSGHAHSVQVAKTQPVKMAAFEALWETQRGAPLVNFGIPDVKNETNHFLFEFPKMLSFLVYGDFDAEMKGLKAFPKEERPPVLISFAAYHIMVFCGVWFALLAGIAGYLMLKKKLFDRKWFHYILLFSIPLPHVANQFGWIAAEVGRQPWVVYGVMKTGDAVSKAVSAGQILFSLICFVLLYGLLFWFFIKILRKMISKGPESKIVQGY